MRLRIGLVVLSMTFIANFFPRCAEAGEIEEQLRAEYQNKVLTLREFYKGSKLHFDSGGHLIGRAAVGSWTVDGQIDVTEVHLLRQMLLLTGRRRRLVADPTSGLMKDVLEITASDVLSKGFREFGNKRWRNFETSAQVEVDLDLPSVPRDEKEAASAVNAVFLSPGDDLAEVVPDCWKGFVLKQEERPPINGPTNGVDEIGKRMGVSPPRAVSAPDPDYSEEARQVGFEGTTVLALTVTPEGRTRDIRVTKPLGLGLDEKAVQAVSRWKFKPARKDGNPVAVQINVESTFRLY